MWPPVIYFTFSALVNLGLFSDAKRIAEKYVRTVDENFATTGQLWEKYDAVSGGIGQSAEYETPAMLGWTAGVYAYLDEQLQRL